MSWATLAEEFGTLLDRARALDSAHERVNESLRKQLAEARERIEGLEAAVAILESECDDPQNNPCRCCPRCYDALEQKYKVQLAQNSLP